MCALRELSAPGVCPAQKSTLDAIPEATTIGISLPGEKSPPRIRTVGASEYFGKPNQVPKTRKERAARVARLCSMCAEAQDVEENARVMLTRLNLAQPYSALRLG